MTRKKTSQKKIREGRSKTKPKTTKKMCAQINISKVRESRRDSQVRQKREKREQERGRSKTKPKTTKKCALR